MTYSPITQTWPGKRAILIVHGIGDTKPGDLDGIILKIQTAIGDTSGTFAYYPLYYDFINEWFSKKTTLAANIKQLKAFLKIEYGGDEIADILADFGGDVLWPVLSLDARNAIQTWYMAQLNQIVTDGINSGVAKADQRISIICHSLGCFHTYEALHRAASEPALNLTPGTDGVHFDTIIFMASPVKLIRTVAEKLGPLVPPGLAALSPQGLFCPYEKGFGETVFSTKKWISITGNLDPVGGYLFRKQLKDFYMIVPPNGVFPGQTSIIDNQDWCNIGTVEELADRLASALITNAAPDIKPNDPHSWDGYLVHHAKELNSWLTA